MSQPVYALNLFNVADKAEYLAYQPVQKVARMSECKARAAQSA